MTRILAILAHRAPANAERLATGGVHTERPARVRMAHAAILFAAIATAFLAITACATPARGRGPSTAASNAEAWLTGKTWRLAGYSYAGQFIPLEPGHGTTARVTFNADGTLEGFTGSNAFGGSWRLGKESAASPRAFSATVSNLAKKAAPNETAARFEADLVRELAAARAIKREKDAFRLLDGHGDVLLRFIFSAAGDLY